MVTRRAAELGIEYVYQGSELRSQGQSGGKLPQYQRLLGELNLTDEQAACVGDDLADLPLITRCGLGVCVPNGHPTVRRAAAHVTHTAGGQGVARELAESLLRAQQKWPY